ncbi:MAG: alpha/beta fold hydrolase [Chromatiaceae bacterium]|nr:alpha/beta fold hydrolase [Chromatiaceae bacterium]
MSSLHTQPPLARQSHPITVEQGDQVWSCSVGGGGAVERTPLLILHGGPGVPHDYLENLEALASRQQRVIFYDQLGCGRSDQPDDPARWPSASCR